MSGQEDPTLESMIEDAPPDAQDPAVRERIRRLLDGQPFAVLCTQGGGQPYGSVIA